MKTTRLGVYGGTFDPVHHGHLIAASETRHALSLDLVLFVPAGQPPHKPDRVISSAEDRLAMLEIALEGRPWAATSTLDVEKPGPSYTTELLELLQGDHPGAELYFVMGADSLIDLPNWRSPERIMRQARLAAALRPGASVAWRALEVRLPGIRERVDLVDIPEMELSSSEIRRRARAGQPFDFHVPAGVERYILDHQLYGSPGNDGRKDPASAR